MPVAIPIVRMDDEDDDWLNPPTQGGAADPLVDQEYTRIASRYSDAGYREGITDGKLATLQEGFDEGFAMSVPLSRQIGLLRGKAAALLAYATSSSSFTSTSSSSAAAAAAAKEPSSMTSAIEEVREYVRQLSRIRRDDVLPLDQERLAHEREEHADVPGFENDDGFELDHNDKRDMEALERSLEMLGDNQSSSAASTRKSGVELVHELEERLAELQARIIARN